MEPIWYRKQLEKREALIPLVRQIPGAHLKMLRGGDVLIVIPLPHADGTHSVLWSNYPCAEPAIYRIFSHHGEYSPEAQSAQKKWTVVSTEQLLSTLKGIYDNTVVEPPVPINLVMAIKQQTGVAWVETIAKITHGDLPDARPVDIAADIFADLLEYIAANKLTLDEVAAAAKEAANDAA